MKINVKDKDFVKFLQEGGAMEGAAPVELAPAEPAPAEAGGNPEELILQAAAQAVQTNDAQLALQVCAALVQMAGGSAAPAEAPAEPVYKKGGKLVRRLS